MSRKYLYIAVLLILTVLKTGQIDWIGKIERISSDAKETVNYIISGID